MNLWIWEDSRRFWKGIKRNLRQKKHKHQVSDEPDDWRANVGVNSMTFASSTADDVDDGECVVKSGKTTSSRPGVPCLMSLEVRVSSPNWVKSGITISSITVELREVRDSLENDPNSFASWKGDDDTGTVSVDPFNPTWSRHQFQFMISFCMQWWKITVTHHFQMSLSSMA